MIQSQPTIADGQAGNDQYAGVSQYGDDADDVADDGGMTTLPNTGGPSVLLLGTALLMVAGGLGLATLRKRFE